MKIKSLKRFPYKIIIQIPFVRQWMIWLFNHGGDSVRHHLYDMLSSKPPLLFRRDELYSINAWGKSYLSPVRKDHYAEDWNLLFSIGHDIAIKILYRRLIKTFSVSKFIDVGANYGLHSMIFRSYGIEGVAIEPNPECVSRIKWLANVNSFDMQVVNKAVSDTKGSSVLQWPEGKTWLASIDDKDNVKKDLALLSAEVEVDTLDRLGVINGACQLVKIDVEGHEQKVLEGGRQSIKKWNPVIVFESIDYFDGRDGIYDFFYSLGYKVYGLSANYTESANIKDRNDFIDSKFRNFIAVPCQGNV